MSKANRVKVAFIQKEWGDNLGILWIASLLAMNKFSTRILVEQKSTYKELKDFSPDIIGYSCITGQHKWVFSSIAKIKSIGITAKIIAGGPHPTFFPDFIQNKSLDAICLGEGEYAMLEYAQSIEEGKENYNINNLYYNLNGKIIKNRLRPLITNLDSLPLPDRSYYDRYRFLAQYPYKMFITSRGCPFQCAFCFNYALQELYGNTGIHIRRRSVQNVIEELRQVRDRWGIDEVRFCDDHFTLNTSWLKYFSDIYKKEINRPYTINTRADAMNEEKIVYLKESGCRLVCFGIETGSNDLRNKLLKKDIEDEEIFKLAGLLKKYKLKFLTSNIIGLPNETVKEAWKTIEINQKIKTDLPWFSMMQYYPGTQVYNEAKNLGLLDENFNVDNIDNYFKNNYLRQKNLSELQNIHSFSILICWHKFLSPIAKLLSSNFQPNPLFRIIFKISYFILTLKRANFKPAWILKEWRYCLGKIVE